MYSQDGKFFNCCCCNGSRLTDSVEGSATDRFYGAPCYPLYADYGTFAVTINASTIGACHVPDGTYQLTGLTPGFGDQHVSAIVAGGEVTNNPLSYSVGTGGTSPLDFSTRVIVTTWTWDAHPEWGYGTVTQNWTRTCAPAATGDAVSLEVTLG